MPTQNLWLHRFAKLLVASTFLLIFIGGLVTSTGSGLSVPDWPTTYGQFMFSFPFSEMVGGILYEHGHRMIATLVGMLTIILTVWLWLKEPRRWVNWFGTGALLAVIAQGVLGGITVIYLLPTAISVFHACLAQAFFCMTLCLAMFTSPSWSNQTSATTRIAPRTQYLAVITTAIIFVQLILGAVMRHTGSGLAIPDFPLAFGKIIPPIASQQIAIHFLHRIGALLVIIAVSMTGWNILKNHRHLSVLRRPALTLVIALVVQIALAATTIWTRKAVLPTTAHVAVGAFILGNSLLLSMRINKFAKLTDKKSHQPHLVEQPIFT